MTKPQKICSKCRITKPVDEFNFRYKARNIRHGYCKECGKVLTRNHYENNKRQYLDKNLLSFQMRREFTRQLKNRPCADCGVIYPYYVMDFDHREDEIKRCGLSETYKLSINAIKSETAKCDVVCSNCHRERTHQRRIRKLESQTTQQK